MLKDCPQGNLNGSPFKSFLYRKFIASQNSFLFSMKLYSSKRTAKSQFDAPGSFASLTARSLAGERDCSIAAVLISLHASFFVSNGAVIFFELSKCSLATSYRISILNPPSRTGSWKSDCSLSAIMESRSVGRKVLLMMSSSGFRCSSISCIVLMK